jgi:hypothetical protein
LRNLFAAAHRKTGFAALNHLLRASPATFYMHVGGHGDPARMAAVIRDALGASKTPLATPEAAGMPPAVDLDMHFRAVDDALKLARGLRAARGKTASVRIPG